MRFSVANLGEVSSDGRDPKTMGVERILVPQNAPGDAGELVGQGRRQLVAVKS